MESCIYLETIRIFVSSMLPYLHLSSVCLRTIQSVKLFNNGRFKTFAINMSLGFSFCNGMF